MLLAASRRLVGMLSPGEVYQAIYEETAAAIPAQSFFLALHDPASDETRVVLVAERGVGRRVDLPCPGPEADAAAPFEAQLVSDGVIDTSWMAHDGGEPSPARSSVSAPLTLRGHVLGLIRAHSDQVDGFGEEHLRMLEELAHIAAVAISNAQQFADLDRRRREAEKLEEIGRALTSKLDPDQVVRLIVSAVSDMLTVDGVSLWLSDTEHTALYRVAESSGAIALPIGLQWQLPDDLNRQMVDQWKPLHVDIASVVQNGPERLATDLAGSSAVGVPLVLGGQVEGVLMAVSQGPRHPGAEKIAILQRLASQASVALGNARLHASLHALSLTDPLTGLPNRRRLQIHLDHEVAAARRGRPMAIAIFDLDKFKHYNDTFGHIAGDEILKAFGAVLEKENRAMNIVARYGGDEFVAVLSEPGLEGVKYFVDRIREQTAQNSTLAKFGISISIGCAHFDPNTMSSVNDVLRAADADMYDAKARQRENERGHNQP